jgi:hypothetical protein
MSFTRIDLLPRYDLETRQQAQERWEDDAGRALFERIITLIREGAGEDFLQCSFEEGRLNGFLNCDFKETSFSDCYFSENMFNSCRFDGNVRILNATKPLVLGLRSRANNFNDELEQNRISGIYQGIKDGYLAGEIFPQARQYLFLQRQAYTRFNSIRKIRDYMWEGVAGYGLKPERVLSVIGLLFGLTFAWFSWRLENAKDALILSAGGIFTFGAKAELLGTLPLSDVLIYIVSAFLGVALVALFVTVLANVLLKDI